MMVKTKRVRERVMVVVVRGEKVEFEEIGHGEK